MKRILTPTIVLLLLGGCAQAPESFGAALRSERTGVATGSSPSPTARDIEGCPVTVPPGFVPPKPYPPEPPFEQVWYGTAELWTLLDSEGAVWRDLPVGKGPHAVGNKTLWFSENLTTAKGEDFSGDARITVTAVDLDRPSRKVVEEGGVPSFNHAIRNFMLVGLGLPEPGCWEVTARYKGAELSYVLLVEG